MAKPQSKPSAGGIFEMTGREVGNFAEETYYWGESVFQNVGNTLQNLFGDFLQGLTRAGDPPTLSAAARTDPSQYKKKR